MKLRRLLLSGSIFLLSAGASFGRQQTASAAQPRTQSESLGDAARKARAEKKPAARSARVFTNDDMARIKDTPSPVRHRAASASRARKSASTAKETRQTGAHRPEPSANPLTKN